MPGPTPLPADYPSLSAADKLERLWANVASDPYPEGELPRQPPSGWARRKLFSVGFDRVSFEHVSDELPPGRVKLVHRWGTTAKVSLDIDDPRGFTGFFATGGRGLLRFSDAAGAKAPMPSLAIKLFVDGQPSVNFLALPTQLRRPEDRDVLSSAYANSTPPPTAFDAKLLGRAFQRTASALGGKRLYSVYLPLHHIASVAPDGSRPESPRVPDRLELHPTAVARDAHERRGDWREGLGRLPAGLKLFELRAAETIDAPAERIGTLRLDEPFVASAYGDDRLFFQHDVGPT